jgi:hypothetical protein
MSAGAILGKIEESQTPQEIGPEIDAAGDRGKGPVNVRKLPLPVNQAIEKY